MWQPLKHCSHTKKKQYQHEYSVQDPGLTFVVEDVPTPEIVYAEDTTEALITYIYLAQDGVHSVSKSIPNLVETSNNIAIVRENQHTMKYSFLFAVPIAIVLNS